MIIHCDKHVFAHRGHYRTIISSDGLSPEEVAQLEQYQFGQTNDQSYLNSLNHDPGVILRLLDSGRFALTRVAKGPQDAAGRNTLAFVTLVFDEATWSAALSNNLIEIVSLGDTVWDARTPKIDIPSPKPFPLGQNYDVRTADELVRQFKQAADSNVALFCYSDMVTLPVLGHVISTSATEDLRLLSFAYRALSDAIPVQLNVLERRYNRSGSARPCVWFNDLRDDLKPRVSDRTDSPTASRKVVAQPAIPPRREQRGAKPMPANTRQAQMMTTLNTVLSFLILAGVVLLCFQGRVLAPSAKESAPPATQETLDKQVHDDLKNMLDNIKQLSGHVTKVQDKIKELEGNLTRVAGTNTEQLTEQLSELKTEFIDSAENNKKQLAEKLDKLEQQAKDCATEIGSIKKSIDSMEKKLLDNLDKRLPLPATPMQGGAK